MIYLFQKGDASLPENVRLICLLLQMYKVVLKIVTNRSTNNLDDYQSVGPAAFRKEFSTCEHPVTAKILIEKSSEYNFILCMAFIDY